MPWKEASAMSLKIDFATLASMPNANISLLSRRFGISRKTAYKWLERYRLDGLEGLKEKTRTPHFSPNRLVDEKIVSRILHWRDATGWGGRKIKHLLEQENLPDVPAASTISAVLKRHGRISHKDLRTPFRQRFEYENPNDLWQMDFKGPIRLRDRSCEPLTVLDDHSRFSLGIRACQDHTGDTVKQHLSQIFRTYGMPWRILADNGKPWAHFNERNVHTALSVWLLQIGIELIHSRPYHPQTCGKEERFHRTLKRELTGTEMNCPFDRCQEQFDRWRYQYNNVRPHEALDMQTPASRYRPSARTFPEKIPQPEYDNLDVVRKAGENGRVRYKGVDYPIGCAFKGHMVALRPTERDGILAVYFHKYKVAELNLKTGKKS